MRLYAGTYHFDGDHTDSVTGWRTRLTTDITENFQLGVEFQKDDVRGSQGFLNATLRFPYGSKKSYRQENLIARLDESPQRDIDIVTNETVTGGQGLVSVLNRATGQPQVVLSVDNSAATDGDGSVDNPFNTLASAEAAALDHTIIYVRQGDGTNTRQDQGITLARTGLKLYGAGTDFIYDNTLFTTAGGASLTPSVIVAAQGAPVISNINPNEDGITISANNVGVAGIMVDNASTGRDGIAVLADGAGASAQNTTIRNVTVQNSRMGVYLHGSNGGSLSAMVQSTAAISNSQHGIAVYDDTNGVFDVDLGGGSQGSTGRNILAGNTLEDLAVDYDGRELAAMNNWWGQSTGPDTDAPSTGIAPQIYYGAPLNDGLVTNFTLDSQWVDGTNAYDRSANRITGAMLNGLNDTALSSSCAKGECLQFDGFHNIIRHDGTILPQDGITVISWVNQSALGNFYDHYKNNWDASSNPASWNLFTNSTGRVIFGLWGTTTGGQRQAILPNGTLSLNTWNMLAGTYDGTTVSSYYNAGTPATTNAPGFTLRNNSSLYFGEFGPGLPSYYVDDTRIYNRALSASEISEIYRMDATSTVNTTGYLTATP